MNLKRKSSQRYQPGIKMYFMGCCIFMILLSAAIAKSNGKGIGIDNPHANPNANLHINPLANPRVNPAGIITGSGGTSADSPATNQRGALISHEVTHVGAPKKHFVVKDGGSMFLGMSGSNVLVQIGAPSGTTSLGKNGHICLGAGDSFSNAIENIDTLASTLEVPNPIGAKGPNPMHGGQHPKKGDGSPGGGNGKGNWGLGNNGNGFGNIWTGNQGRGVGEGMAGVTHNSPPEPPNPPGPPNPGPPNPPGPPDPPEPPVSVDPAPLYRLTGLPLEKEEFENGGCPALIKMLAAELGINEEDLQIAIANAFISSTNIQACKMAAAIMNAAKILKDPAGKGVASLGQVINEFITEGGPVSEEQMSQIAAALADHKGDGTYYAMAGEWLNAFVKYVDILINDLGFSAEDATAFVMDKYGASIKDSDDASLLVAYIDAQLPAE